MQFDDQGQGLALFVRGPMGAADEQADVITLGMQGEPVCCDLPKTAMIGASGLCACFRIRAGFTGAEFSLYPCGCSSMVEPQLPKLMTWVRFPSPAPSSAFLPL